MKIVEHGYADRLYEIEKLNSIRIDGRYSIILNDMRNINLKIYSYWRRFYNEEKEILIKLVRERYDSF